MVSDPIKDFDFVHENGARSEINLPAQLGVPGGSLFILERNFTPGKYKSVMIRTMYTSLKLYANDELIYEGGQSGSYPAWLIDPPTLLKIQPIPETTSVLRFEYVAPTQRNSTLLPVVWAGDEAALMESVLAENRILQFISIFLIFMGIAIPIFAGIFLKTPNEKAIIVWLSLSALALGLWGFGESDASQLFFPFPVLLNIMANMGLFIAVVPLLNFGLVVLRPRHPGLMKTAIASLYVTAIVAFSLQITGIAALSLSLYVFQVLAPLGVAAFTFTIFWEYFRYVNKTAKNFILPGVIIFLSVLLEVLNSVFRLIDIQGFFVLSGFIAFFFILIAIGLQYIRDTVQINTEKKRLEDQVRFTNRQIAIQREQYAGITESMEQAKKARHDLRHQLSVIHGFNELGEQENLREYLEELISNIPVAYEKTFCENMAVNSIVAHYGTIAESEGIDVDVKINIPEKSGEVPAMDLCVILGNFLENAIDACRRMKESKKYIRIWTKNDEDTLSIVVENSYDGIFREKGDVYLSRKDYTFKREGVGIDSVKTVCERHRGLVRIDTSNDVWKSSALVHI
jgi:signal transduction histidine kinase